MSELEDDGPLDARLRSALDGIAAPDLWGEATSTTRPRTTEHGSDHRTRIVAFVVGLAVFVLSVGALLQLRHGSAPEPSPGDASVLLSTSAMVKDLHGIRCTATVPAVVAPGELLDVSYTLVNLSDRAKGITIQPETFPMDVVAADGSSWDTTDLTHHSWPIVRGEQLAPGESRFVDGNDLERLYVQFPGPVSVTPTCAGQPLGTLRVDVSASGPAPTESDAISRAASATSGLFDRCMPTANGPVIGVVGPPPGANFPGLKATCVADVNTWDGFSVVTFSIVSPVGRFPFISVPKTPGLAAFTRLPTLPEHTNTEVVAWRFVVPSQGDAIPVGTGIVVTSRPSGGRERWYDVSATGWERSGYSRCGGTGGGGGSSSTAAVVFLDRCRSS